MQTHLLLDQNVVRHFERRAPGKYANSSAMLENYYRLVAPRQYVIETTVLPYNYGAR